MPLMKMRRGADMDVEAQVGRSRRRRRCGGRRCPAAADARQLDNLGRTLADGHKLVPADGWYTNIG